MSISGEPEAPFFKTLDTFCGELRLTFPELTPQIDRAGTQTPQVFWRTWGSHIQILKDRNFDLLTSERRGFILGAVAITPALWEEVSPATHDAIWRYLRTLLLEAATEIGLDDINSATMKTLLDIFKEERMDAMGEAFSSMYEDISEGSADIDPTKFMEASSQHLLPFLKKLREMVDSSSDTSGMDIPALPEIPEHLRNGYIARLAEDLAKQFRPEEFGIDPALLTGDSVEEVLKRLADLYTRDPSVFIAGMKRITEKIKRQIAGGSLNRDQIIAEAKEYMALFKDHPLFKGALEKVQGLFGAGGIGELFGGGGSSGAPSERLRAVQERLRRKMAARNAGGKTSAQGK